MREKTNTNPRRAQCVRQRCTTSMTWTNQTTRGKYPCMSSGDQQSFIRGDFAQLALFDRKGTPPVYLLLPTNDTRFTYVTRKDSWPSLELCILLNCCKCTVFAMNRSQNQKVLATFSRVAFLQTEVTDFPTLILQYIYTSTKEMVTLSYTWGLKKIPLSGGVSPYRQILRNNASTPRKMILSAH